MKMSNLAACTKMTFQKKNNRIIATEAYHEGNARISANMMVSTDDTPYYFLITMGGGYVEGEEYLTRINVKKDARALLTSQSPTYIFRSLNGEETKQTVKLNLEENSTLEYLMDDLLPYEDAIFNQETIINLTKSSNLIYLDGVTSGWSPKDMDFCYQSICLDTKVYMDERLILSDHFICEPNRYNTLNTLGLFEKYPNYNTLIVINPKIDKKYIENLRKELNKLRLDVKFGISELEVPGFVMRILSRTVDDSKLLILKCADKVRTDLFGLDHYDLRKNDHISAIIDKEGGLDND